MIDSFTNEYRWLSNFWGCPVKLDGEWYLSVEAAYVAAKTLDPEERKAVRKIKQPGKAKRFGRRLNLRPDWEEVKVEVMLKLLRQKFAIGTNLGNRLTSTGSEELVEGNTWGDTFWGVCGGEGQNMLGKLLMQVREELRSAEKGV